VDIVDVYIFLGNTHFDGKNQFFVQTQIILMKISNFHQNPEGQEKSFSSFNEDYFFSSFLFQHWQKLWEAFLSNIFLFIAFLKVSKVGLKIMLPIN